MAVQEGRAGMGLGTAVIGAGLMIVGAVLLLGRALFQSQQETGFFGGQESSTVLSGTGLVGLIVLLLGAALLLVGMRGAMRSFH